METPKKRDRRTREECTRDERPVVDAVVGIAVAGARGVGAEPKRRTFSAGRARRARG